jgi:secreted trypsin-like serine protease
MKKFVSLTNFGVGVLILSLALFLFQCGSDFGKAPETVTDTATVVEQEEVETEYELERHSEGSVSDERTEMEEELEAAEYEINAQKQVIAEVLKKEEINLFEKAKMYIIGDTTKKEGRIINGQLVIGNDKIPWQVALIVKGSIPSAGQFCGGSIINDRWVITAAHCLEGVNPTSVQIFSGSVNLNSGGNTSDVKRIIIHPNYIGESFDNDIALVELNTPLQMSNEQKAVVLPDKDINKELLRDGFTATVSGWGVTETGKPSTSLRMVEIKHISERECKGSYGSAITENMICAGAAAKDACQGDSGGPLTVVDVNGDPVLVGIVSWGKGCAQSKYYGVYTKVHNFVDWINSSCGDTNTQASL